MESNPRAYLSQIRHAEYGKHDRFSLTEHLFLRTRVSKDQISKERE
jgi:hypothetical protein